ncbi:Hypothetical protein FKW44_000780 [Caligus rogercresseyi]|uniref:Uncharacterized protein n=1 Tax=Caligus rogercresseyi TaxID=217165 RepID=A0A7T8QV59_CALRO|nr:Hypothetical protein FKW44_000780 [Caligus rogercresseyi]
MAIPFGFKPAPSTIRVEDALTHTAIDSPSIFVVLHDFIHLDFLRTPYSR